MELPPSRGSSRFTIQKDVCNYPFLHLSWVELEWNERFVARFLSQSEASSSFLVWDVPFGAPSVITGRDKLQRRKGSCGYATPAFWAPSAKNTLTTNIHPLGSFILSAIPPKSCCKATCVLESSRNHSTYPNNICIILSNKFIHWYASNCIHQQQLIRWKIDESLIFDLWCVHSFIAIRPGDRALPKRLPDSHLTWHDEFWSRTLPVCRFYFSLKPNFLGHGRHTCIHAPAGIRTWDVCDARQWLWPLHRIILCIYSIITFITFYEV